MFFKKINFNMFSKVMLCLLCCLVLFFTVSRPIIAQASVTATVAFGAYGVIKVIISSKALVGLIIGSFVGFGIGTLFADIDEWYESDTTIRNWADQYNGAINGGEVITIPDNVQGAIRDRYDVADTINISTLYVPYDLTHLEKVSAAHIFGTDVAAQLEANNALVSQTNSLVGKLITAVNSMAYSLYSVLDSMHSTFYEEFRQFKSWYSDINENLKAEVHQIPNWLSNINTNMKSEFGQVKTWLSNINTNMKQEFAGVKTVLVQIKDSIKNDIISSINSITNTLNETLLRIESKIDSLTKVDSDLAQPPNSSGGNTNDSVDSGINSGLQYFGQSNGILAQYASAFYAVGLIFNLFTSITFFKNLITVSASIGIVAAILGLFLNSAQADSAARKEAEREAKREARRSKGKGG